MRAYMHTSRARRVTVEVTKKRKNKGGGKRGKRKRKGKEEGKEEVKGEKEESFYSKPAPSLRLFLKLNQRK